MAVTPTPPTTNYGYLSTIKDPSTRRAVKLILDRLGDIELRSGGIGALTKPLTDDLNAAGNQLKSLKDPTNDRRGHAPVPEVLRPVGDYRGGDLAATDPGGAASTCANPADCPRASRTAPHSATDGSGHGPHPPHRHDRHGDDADCRRPGYPRLGDHHRHHPHRDHPDQHDLHFQQTDRSRVLAR